MPDSIENELNACSTVNVTEQVDHRCEPAGCVHERGCAVEPERSVRQRGGATEFENARETRTERLYVEMLVRCVVSLGTSKINKSVN